MTVLRDYATTLAQPTLPLGEADPAARYDEVAEVPIRPLLDRLEFLRGRGRNWGMALRGGRFSISEADYRLIAGAMGLG